MTIDRTRCSRSIPALLLSVLLAGAAPAGAETSTGLTLAGLARWLDAYGEAWESRDADKAAELFAKDSSYRVSPFEEPHVGRAGVREYWQSVTENQRNVEFEYQVIDVQGNTGIAHWSARFDVEPDGPRIELDGIFVLDFDEHGKCRQLREWWHMRSEGAD